MLFCSSTSVGIDVIPQHELAKAGFDFSRLPRGLRYDDLNDRVRERLGLEVIPSVDEFIKHVPLGDIDIASYGAGRLIVGAAIPRSHMLYDERAEVQDAIQRFKGHRIPWSNGEIFLNMFEFMGDTKTADEVCELIFEEYPERTDVYDLTIRHTTE
jgi:hypothetical protein